MFWWRMVLGRMFLVITRCSLQRTFRRHRCILWQSWSINSKWCDTINFPRWRTSCRWERLIALLAMHVFFVFRGELCGRIGRPEIYSKGAWAPICSSGISSGSAAVICKSMGFRGSSDVVTKCTSKDSCGDVPPGVSELACSGQESNALDCPHAAGSDVFCAPSESIVVNCAGTGETQGRPAKEAAPQPV